MITFNTLLFFFLLNAVCNLTTGPLLLQVPRLACEKVANPLFLRLLWGSSTIKHEEIKKLLDTCDIKCEQFKCNKRDVLRRMILLYDHQINYYNNIRNKTKAVYIEAIGYLSISAIMGYGVGLISYVEREARIPEIFKTRLMIPKIIVMLSGILGIQKLCDQLYAQFYYERCCFIKEELQKHLDALKQSETL